MKPNDIMNWPDESDDSQVIIEMAFSGGTILLNGMSVVQCAAEVAVDDDIRNGKVLPRDRDMYAKSRMHEIMEPGAEIDEACVDRIEDLLFDLDWTDHIELNVIHTSNEATDFAALFSSRDWIGIDVRTVSRDEFERLDTE